MRWIAILFILLACCFSVSAQPGGGREVTPASAELSELSWLGGYWKSDKRGVVAEECWLPPEGGVMLGLHRDTFGDGRMFFEYLRIMTTPEGIYYYATPRGYDTAKFLLTFVRDEDGVKQAVFENPENDFPSLIRYTLNKHGLMAEVEGTEDNNRVLETWIWQRAVFPSAVDE